MLNIIFDTVMSGVYFALIFIVLIISICIFYKKRSLKYAGYAAAIIITMLLIRCIVGHFFI